MPTTKLQELPNGTLITSIPRPYAELLGLTKGDNLHWHVLINEKTLTLKRVKK